MPRSHFIVRQSRSMVKNDLMRSELVILCTYERYCHDTCVVSHKELSAVVGTLRAGPFLLQRIIRHLALSCVIIFLYLKRGGKAVVCKDLWCDDPRD